MKPNISDSLDGFSFAETTCMAAKRSKPKLLRILLQCSLALTMPSALALALAMQSPLANAQSEPFPGLGIRAMTQAPDVVWVKSLIDLRASDLAVEVCQVRLDRSVPESNAHAQWQMLLLHAKTAQGLEQVDWNASVDSLESILAEVAKLARVKEQNTSPRGPWVRWKELWCRRLVNQHTLAAYLAVPGRKSHHQWLLQSIRRGLDELERLEQTVSKMQPDKPLLTKAQRELKDKTLPNEITAGEILDLRGQIELLRADLLYQQSQCYPVQSDEQIAAATQMLTSIDRAKNQLPATWTHRPLLTLAQSEAELQLGRHASVQKSMGELWDLLSKDTNSEAQSWRNAAASLAIRSARISEQWPTVEAWFAKAGGWENSPELALEHLAMLVKRELNRSESPESILRLRKGISDRFGRYWEQRADAMLVSSGLMSTTQSSRADSSSPDTKSMASLELFRIQARQAIAANNFEMAIEKLQQAELAASKLGATQEAFAFAMQVAALLEQTGQHSAAADEFYRSAISYPESPKASAAAMMSAWLIRNPDPKLDAESQQLRQATYLQRLKETALNWPEAQQSLQAIDLLEIQGLSSGELASLLEFWKEFLQRASSGNTQGIERRALGRLLLVRLVTQEDWLERPLQENPLLSKLSTELQEALLQRATSKSEKSPDQGIRPEALSAWFDSLKPDRRWAKPSSIETISFEESDLLGRLADSWNRCEDAWQTGRLTPTQLSELEQLRESLTQRLGSRVVIAGGRLDRFIDLVRLELGSSDSELLKRGLEARIAKDPKSLWWVYRSARTMQRTKGLNEKSLGWYRQMASGVTAGSEPWLEARARTIQVLEATGEQTKARELSELVLASYPNVPVLWKSRLMGSASR